MKHEEHLRDTTNHKDYIMCIKTFDKYIYITKQINQVFYTKGIHLSPVL